MHEKLLDEHDVFGRLVVAIQAAGGEAAFARKVGVTARQVDFVIKGHRQPRGKILAALDLELVTAFREAPK